MSPETRKISPVQMSESLTVGALLALSGGYMDAYSYLAREYVFANAQTGNVLLLGVHLSKGEWNEGLAYLCPILAFVVGIAFSTLCRSALRASHFHWRQGVVLAECLIMALVAFVPGQMNLEANSLISFSCGMQVEAFRKILGNAMATTMCIGNLRSATWFLSHYCRTRDSRTLKSGLLYLLVIGLFAVGAALGAFCIGLWQLRAIMGSAVLLFLCFLLMFSQNGLSAYWRKP